MKGPHFAAIVQGLGISDWSRPQRRLLEVLQKPENRSKSALQICRLAGYKDHVAWQRAIKDKRFVAAVEALGVTLRRRNSPLLREQVKLYYRHRLPRWNG